MIRARDGKFVQKLGLERYSVRSLYLPKPVFALTIASLLAWLIYTLWIVRPLLLAESYPEGRLDGLYIYRNKPFHQVRLLTCFLALGLLYLWGWWAARKVQSNKDLRYAWIVILLGAFACATTLMALYPFDAADIFDNIMHGRILAVYGGNPFVQVGRDFVEDPFYTYMAWKKSPSAYGPLWEIMAGFTARIAGDGIVVNILLFKLLPGIFWAASVFLVALFLSKYVPDQALAGVYLFAWNPMVLYATFGNGHNDIVMVFWVLLAIWASQTQHHTSAVLALLAGALVKYIPLLLLPTVIWYALKRLDESQPVKTVGTAVLRKIMFLLVTGTLGLFLIWLVYAPFWAGWETLSLERRARLYTSSIPAVVYHVLTNGMGGESASQLVSRVAAVVTVAFVIWRTWRLGKEPTGRYDTRFSKASFDILLFYLLATCLWFQQWYTVWLVGVAAMLTYGRRQRIAAYFSLAAFLKQLLLAPMLFKPKPIFQQPELEVRFTIGVLGLPWLYLMAAYFGSERLALLQLEPMPNIKTESKLGD